MKIYKSNQTSWKNLDMSELKNELEYRIKLLNPKYKTIKIVSEIIEIKRMIKIKEGNRSFFKDILYKLRLKNSNWSF